MHERGSRANYASCMNSGCAKRVGLHNIHGLHLNLADSTRVKEGVKVGLLGGSRTLLAAMTVE